MDINAKQTDVSSFDNEAVTNVQQENPPSSAGLSKEAIIISTRQNQLNSPLLQLPGELRNKIYSYALGGLLILNQRSSQYPQPTIYRIETIDESVSNPLLTTAQSGTAKELLYLSQTCRQLHSETSLLPFQLNLFYANNFQRIHQNILEPWIEPNFLMQRQLEAKTRLSINSLDVRLSLKNRRELLRTFTGLKTIRIRYWIGRNIRGRRSKVPRPSNIRKNIEVYERLIGRNDLDFEYAHLTYDRDGTETRAPWRELCRCFAKWKAGKIRQVDYYDCTTEGEKLLVFQAKDSEELRLVARDYYPARQVAAESTTSGPGVGASSSAAESHPVSPPSRFFIEHKFLKKREVERLLQGLGSLS